MEELRELIQLRKQISISILTNGFVDLPKKENLCEATKLAVNCS